MIDLTAIHPNPFVGFAVILLGVLLGIALALSQWRGKLGIGTLATSGVSAVTSLTAERWTALKDFIAATALLNPLLLGLDIFLVSFSVTLGLGAVSVFLAHLVPAVRAGDPDSVSKATKKAITLVGYGLLHYASHSPDAVATARIKDLERRNDGLWLLQKTIVKETLGRTRSRDHFVDTVAALGHLALQQAFGEDTDLQHYRLAFFEKRGDRLEYLVAVNNGDWTAHSMEGFPIESSFMGLALKKRKPLVFPRDKKFRDKFLKRGQPRYKSFVAIPTPCDSSLPTPLGVLTVDAVEDDGVFSAGRVETLVALTQAIAALYFLNMPGGPNEETTPQPRLPSGNATA